MNEAQQKSTAAQQARLSMRSGEYRSVDNRH